jgi:hypothetical protein
MKPVLKNEAVTTAFCGPQRQNSANDWLQRDHGTLKPAAEVAQPRVEEYPGLPEAFTEFFRRLAARRDGIGVPGQMGTSRHPSIPTCTTRKEFQRFGFVHGRTKNSNSVGKR